MIFIDIFWFEDKGLFPFFTLIRAVLQASPASEAGPPIQRVRPDEPRQASDRHVPGGARVRLEGIIFGGLRPMPTNTSIDPPPYHCFNCWQPNHYSGQCPRRRVRVYCRNCGRHGEDLNSCPRCGEAHAEFLRRNFGGERRYERERSSGAGRP